MAMTPQHQLYHEMINELEQKLHRHRGELRELENAEERKGHLRGLLQAGEKELARLSKLIPTVETGAEEPRRVIQPAESTSAPAVQPAAPGSPARAQTVIGRPRR